MAFSSGILGNARHGRVLVAAVRIVLVFGAVLQQTSKCMS